MGRHDVCATSSHEGGVARGCGAVGCIENVDKEAIHKDKPGACVTRIKTSSLSFSGNSSGRLASRKSEPRPRSPPFLSLVLLYFELIQGLSFHLAVFHPYRALPALVEGARLRAKAAGIPPQPDRIMALHDGARAALDDILVREGELACGFKKTPNSSRCCGMHSAVYFSGCAIFLRTLRCDCRGLGNAGWAFWG